MMYKTTHYPILPVPKPRMTRSDKWKKRPATDRYWAFKDLCKLHRVDLPKSGARVIFVIPMPKSWTKQKREIFNLQRHEQKPDLDNLIKALGDAIYQDDSCISDIHATKIWGVVGEIVIRTRRVE